MIFHSRVRKVSIKTTYVGKKKDHKSIYSDCLVEEFYFNHLKI